MTKKKNADKEFQEIKSCIVCGASQFEFLYNSRDRMFDLSGEFTVTKCKKCSLLFLNPQPGQTVLKKYYPSKKYYSYSDNRTKGIFERLREYLVNHYYSPNIWSRLISTIVHNVPAMPSYVSNGKILDIGCGAGDTLILLKNLGWNTYGVDMDSHAIENAQKRGLSQVKLGTYEYLSNYPDNFFDAIRLYHVIEHIDNPSMCLKLIQQKLKNNGELIIGTPNSQSVLSHIFRSNWYNLDTPRHLFLFSPSNLKTLVWKNGFTTQKIEFCSAGGIPGSIQYWLGEISHKKMNLIHNMFFVLFFYPLEWLLDKFSLGDVFVLRAFFNKK